MIIFVNGLKMDLLTIPDYLTYEQVCGLVGVDAQVVQPTIVVCEYIDSDISKTHQLTQGQHIKLKGRHIKKLIFEIVIPGNPAP